MSTLRLSTAALLGPVAGCLLLASCDFVDRSAVPHVLCNDSECSCAPGFGDCDANLGNGCEIDLRSDSLNCGGCGTECVQATCEDGSCTCLTGRANCDGEPENGCEVDLTRDGQNCGGCGFDCLGGACSAASCLPSVIEPLASPAPRNLAIDDVHLYLATWDRVLALPLAGGAVTSIALGQDDAQCIDVTERHVVWRANDGVWAATLQDKGPPLQVGAPFLIAPASGALAYWRCIAASAPPSSATYQVFWFTDNATQDGMELRKATLTDETVVSVETIATTDYPLSIAADDSVVVWADTPLTQPDTDSGLWTQPVTGGPASQLVADIYVWDLALADGRLYYSHYTAGAIMGMDLDDGAAFPLATGQSFPRSLTVDTAGARLYWANECSGTIVTVPLAGGAPKVVADQGCSPHSVVASGDSVYWIQWDAVMRLAKTPSSGD